ncbi:MAG TPA: hypothetical protein VIX19_11560 [Terriglobales bacterium]
MADMVGRIQVPLPVATGATFPLVSEYGYGMTQDWKVVEHRFNELATMGIQRYAVGSGARRFQFVKTILTYADRQNLLTFYDLTQGAFASFIYPVPNTDRATFTNYTVVFETPPLSITQLTNHAQTGLSFLEYIDPTQAPVYTINSINTRFPTDALAQALASEVQVIIPLVHIKARNTAVPDIYFSDRRCGIIGFPGTTGTQPFLPRLTGVGVPGTSDIIMSQSIDGRAEQVRFTFGNADRAMSQLVNDCSLEYAEIDMSFFHVGTGVLLQLWKGMVITWQIDGTPVMSMQCSDGLYPITQSYPPRTVSRQCWKPFNTAILPGYQPCPYNTVGSGGDPTSCDYGFNSANGCLAHGMSNYFGAHPEQPQSVVITDNGTGIIGGFFRSTVTSTSILSDSIWGNPLPEIWCNDLGSPQRAFWANCLIAAVRDESDYEDILGIVGVGPLGSFEGMSVQTNADGYKFVVAPTADGFFPQGFKVDSQLDQPSIQPNMGLRQSVGYDPALLGTSPQEGIDAFSLGQGTPQRWDEFDPVYSNDGTPNSIIPYAAGTALTEVRYLTSAGTGLTPTTAESHSMQVPIRFGLIGSVFDVNGNRTLEPGVINPFWVGANAYFRALGIQSADAATQLNYIVLDSLTNAQGMGAADIANIWVPPVVGDAVAAFIVTPAGQALISPNLDYYNNTFTYQESSGTIVSISIGAAEDAGYVIRQSQPNQELQFMFQGTIAQFKPFRDWLNEILNCCLGFWCFEFGALKMGIRYSAVPTDSFTLGSMLYQSLVISPISAQFEYLKISFANVELQYQQDLAEYQDKDHAAYYSRAGTPLTSSMNSVGISTLSQGLRVAVSRTREEIGGILRGVPYNGVPDVTTNPYIEWDNNKHVAFNSTLLALNNEVGQVISVTHPDLPTYPGAHPGSRAGSNGPFPPNTWPYRIKKWMLHSDFSVSILADSCVDSMYDLEVGPQPTGAPVRPLPVMFFPEPLGQWAPYQVQADPNDALYPNEFSFNLRQTFSYAADGTLLTAAEFAGALPVNQFIPNCGAPNVKAGSTSWATTGGFLPGGTTVFVQVAACLVDTTQTPPVVQQCSPPSEVLILQVPYGTDTNTITLNNILWPQVAGLNGWIFYCNTIEDMICGQESGLGQPSSITFTGPIQRQTYSVPDYDVVTLQLQASVLIHGGVIGAGVYTVTSSPPTIWAPASADLTGQDNWAGRVLAMIGRQQGDGIAPFSAFNITAFDPATGTYTLDRDPTAGQNPVLPGDVFVVCTYGVPNSANPYVVTDPGLSNATNVPPHTGEMIDDPNRVGQMIRVIKGTSRGMQAKIVSNTATSYTVDQPLPIDATSVWVLCKASWDYTQAVAISNSDPEKVTLTPVEINNYLGLALLCEGVTIASEGGTVNDADACVRMLYIPGVQGTQTVAS